MAGKYGNKSKKYTIREIISGARSSVKAMSQRQEIVERLEKMIQEAREGKCARCGSSIGELKFYPDNDEAHDSMSCPLCGFKDDRVMRENRIASIKAIKKELRKAKKEEAADV